jgi:SAM-dependent methyltransferase
VDQPAEDETTRLRRVYDAYAADDATRARWDPEQPGNRRILAERDALLRDALARAGRGVDAPRTIVDLGCGDGDVLASVLERDAAPGVGLGVDLLEGRLRSARARHPELALVAADGAALPLATGGVDLMLVFTVFSSILDRCLADAVAAEIRRVVRPGGRVVWYDLRRDNPRNPEVRGIPASEVARLFPGWSRSMRTCTLLPPLARRAAGVWPGSYDLLVRVPVLRTHHFGVLSAPLGVQEAS